MDNSTNRIAFVCHPYHRGGVTRWMADMAVAYHKMGYETYFVTVKPLKRFISATRAEPMWQLLRDSGYEGTLISKDVDHVFELSSVHYKADVYHTLIKSHVPKETPIILSDDYAVWLGTCASAVDYKIIGVIHCSVSESYYKQTKEFYEQLSGIVTVSNRCTEKLDLKTDKPLLTQPCGIPMSRPRHTIPMQAFSQLHNLKTRIAWAGRMENSQKRVSDFVLIAEKLRNKGFENFIFDIIGEGSAKASLMTKVKEKGLESHFQFHGWKPKSFIEETLRAAQLYLLPSNYEGYPVAVMEAFANGCVVVSSRVSGIEDLEKEANTAEVLKVFDVGDIDRASQYILDLRNADFVTLAQKSKNLAYKYF
ncbi:MAG TPA: glycosyltransferase, partial [Cytophagales bacterium]|nr:glycosyltransferase [Cytophagales bacterium]